MKHANLNLKSKARGGRRLIQPAVGLLLAVLFLVGCDGASVDPTATTTHTSIPPTATPTPSTGTITGLVLSEGGEPIENTYLDDDETLFFVALLCSNDDQDIDCLQEADLDLGMAIPDRICEAGDTTENCLLHWGQGVVSVEADGSYTIADISPGQYGLILILSTPGHMQMLVERDVGPVQAGEITEYDIVAR
jgi:hypothetical protein